MTAPLKIREMPREDRPRERLAARGASALTDAELIAILLRTGVPGANAVEVARQLIEEYGSLGRLGRCSVKELAKIKGVGFAKATQLAAAFGLGQRLAQQNFAGKRIEKPEQVYELLGPELRALHKESLRIILLDTRYNFIRSGRGFVRQRQRKYRASPRCFSAGAHLLRLRRDRGPQSSFGRSLPQPGRS